MNCMIGSSVLCLCVRPIAAMKIGAYLLTIKHTLHCQECCKAILMIRSLQMFHILLYKRIKNALLSLMMDCAASMLNLDQTFFRIRVGLIRDLFQRMETYIQ